MNDLITLDHITTHIYVIRGLKVMLDRDLAQLYEVETRALKQAVRRNRERFPDDFMFELSKEEFADWRSQFVSSDGDKMGLRHAPMAFTEQGVAMLSSVLRSDRAIKANIQIIRAFVQLRHMVISQADLKRELDELRRQSDERFEIVFTALDKLIADDEAPPRKIGFIGGEG